MPPSLPPLPDGLAVNDAQRRIFGAQVSFAPSDVLRTRLTQPDLPMDPEAANQLLAHYADVGLPGWSHEPWKSGPAWVAAALIQESLLISDHVAGRLLRKSTPALAAGLLASGKRDDLLIVRALETREELFRAPFTWASSFRKLRDTSVWPDRRSGGNLFINLTVTPIAPEEATVTTESAVFLLDHVIKKVQGYVDRSEARDPDPEAWPAAALSSKFGELARAVSETPADAERLIQVKALGLTSGEQRLVHDLSHYAKTGVVVNDIPSGFIL